MASPIDHIASTAGVDSCWSWIFTTDLRPQDHNKNLPFGPHAEADVWKFSASVLISTSPPDPVSMIACLSRGPGGEAVPGAVLTRGSHPRARGRLHPRDWMGVRGLPLRAGEIR